MNGLLRSLSLVWVNLVGGHFCGRGRGRRRRIRLKSKIRGKGKGGKGRGGKGKGGCGRLEGFVEWAVDEVVESG